MTTENIPRAIQTGDKVLVRRASNGFETRAGRVEAIQDEMALVGVRTLAGGWISNWEPVANLKLGVVHADTTLAELEVLLREHGEIHAGVKYGSAKMKASLGRGVSQVASTLHEAIALALLALTMFVVGCGGVEMPPMTDAGVPPGIGDANVMELGDAQVRDAGICIEQRHYNRVATGLGCALISTCPVCVEFVEAAPDCASLERALVPCAGTDGGVLPADAAPEVDAAVEAPLEASEACARLDARWGFDWYDACHDDLVCPFTSAMSAASVDECIASIYANRWSCAEMTEALAGCTR